MRHEYIRFNKYTVAPKGAKSIGVYEIVDKNTKTFIGNISINKMKQPDLKTDNTYRYSFGVVSDTHLMGDSYTSYTDLNNRDPSTAGTNETMNEKFRMRPGTRLRKTLYFMKNTYEGGRKIAFCCSAGDATNVGLYAENKTDLTNQFLEYKDIIDQVGIEMYTACGNHDSYNVAIDEEKLQEYTGHSLTFSITKGDDVFIFIGQPAGNTPMSNNDLKKARSILEDNKEKRCFVFIHSYMEGDSGDPGDYRENSIFFNYETGIEKNPISPVFKQIMKHYKNAILFHGHSHMKFEHQETYQNVNTYTRSIYTDANGFKSVHIPSLLTPRNINENATGLGSDTFTPDDPYKGQGYIVDVYDNYIILNGYTFINTGSDGITVFDPKPSPLGTFKIDTTFDPIGTFDAHILDPLG